ncbi:toxin-antitoxin system YwqK family antitoxin [Chryseolinea lacunae]|uniref:Toxin-antitoxin system YwqK family antitoxin n=1 Tax=Chryseolinea lacunae TaxID=2801331 RepID=A0ABS1KWL3_9BACT|nr:hypothetical protein [Chryseolinea lacunae]MBL0743720.1 hypothetical protein [Chryseolinea lacunae]
MKYALIILLSTLNASAMGQIKFKLYAYSPCSEKVTKIESFGLKKNGLTLAIADTSGVLLLKDTGRYTLLYAMEKIDSTQLRREYYVSAVECFSDTLKLISIDACLEPTSHPNFIGYCCCEKKCQGTQIDFYENGNKRIEGFFKEGIPIGQLKFYYPNGKLKMIKDYSKKGRLKNIKYADHLNPEARF